ncbi:MAG TPA: hypothetical protein P5186_21270 [Candidatus Paceibacterota bacterium]|nr:hypothetical protein [Candidatus Paceibacterota bacterium]
MNAVIAFTQVLRRIVRSVTDYLRGLIDEPPGLASGKPRLAEVLDRRQLRSPV